jgi:hypothetical protein
MDLADKIRKVEALLARAATEGEKQAAFLARQRLVQKADQSAIEYTVSNGSHWKKRLFVAICSKHGVKTYRYKGQKHTTAMVRVTKGFMDLILWPEYKQYAEVFDRLSSDIMNDLIAKIHKVNDEDEIVIAGELTAAVAP